MSKAASIIGIIVGIVIIALSIIVFNADVTIHQAEFETEQLNEVKLKALSGPSYEDSKYYGGDAYTGIQQAAAQTANNLISVFNAVEQNNNAIKTLNDNIMTQHSNTIANQQIVAETNTENSSSIATLVQTCFGYLILSIGLLTEAKYLGGLFTTKKKDFLTTCEAVPASTEV